MTTKTWRRKTQNRGIVEIWRPRHQPVNFHNRPQATNHISTKLVHEYDTSTHFASAKPTVLPQTRITSTLHKFNDVWHTTDCSRLRNSGENGRDNGSKLTPSSHRAISNVRNDVKLSCHDCKKRQQWRYTTCFIDVRVQNDVKLRKDACSSP